MDHSLGNEVEVRARELQVVLMHGIARSLWVLYSQKGKAIYCGDLVELIDSGEG